jgi:hypothetical protein
VKAYFPWCCGAGWLEGDDIQIMLKWPLRDPGWAFFFLAPPEMDVKDSRVLWTGLDGLRLCVRVTYCPDRWLPDSPDAADWHTNWKELPLPIKVYGAFGVSAQGWRGAVNPPRAKTLPSVSILKTFWEEEADTYGYASLIENLGFKRIFEYTNMNTSNLLSVWVREPEMVKAAEVQGPPRPAEAAA